MSGIYNIVHCVRFQTVSRGQVLVFFYRNRTRLYSMKGKQGGTIPTGLKKWSPHENGIILS